MAPLVYNTKRSGTFDLGGRRYVLRRVAFPSRPAPEWFVIDLLENADRAGASREELAEALGRAVAGGGFDREALGDMAARYGTKRTQALIRRALREERPLSFPHDDLEFDALLRIVAGKRKLSSALVEKDYWVTHSLWALHQLGVEIWFKGGTSLSKGFGLIERFSEDLDLKIEPGVAKALPVVGSWKSEGKKAMGERQAFFAALSKVLRVPGATVLVDPAFEDRSFRSATVPCRLPQQAQRLARRGR